MIIKHPRLIIKHHGIIKNYRYVGYVSLTYWHSAKCQLLFSACFLHHRKSIPNGVQIQRNFMEIFMDQKTHNGPRHRLGGAPRGAQPTRARQEAQARPGGLCPPWVPPGPPLCSINTPIFQKPYRSRRKSIPAATSSRNTRSNVDTITEGFTISIGASPMMCE